MAEHFSREGASVIVQDLIIDAAEKVAEGLCKSGGRARAWACDVSDSVAVNTMFEAVGEDFGDIDVVVANAGVRRTEGDGATPGKVSGDPLMEMLDMTDEGWQRMVDIHLNGAFACARAMLRRRVPKQLPCNFIGIASISILGGYGPIHYTAAKGGILGLVRGLAFNGGQYGVRANAICPRSLRPA